MIKGLLVGIVTFFVSGCSEIEWTNIDIPKDKKDYYLGHPFSSNSRQLSYVNETEYPDKTIISKLDTKIPANWTRCGYGRDKWQDFGDISGEEPKHIHQFIKTWRSPDKNRLIFSTLRYESSPCECCDCKPENHIQKVVIIEHVKPWWDFWTSFDELCK